MKARSLLKAIFDRTVTMAHPRRCLPAHLPSRPQSGRLILLAAGKAAGSMTEAAEAHYCAAGIDPQRIIGLAATRYGYTRPTRLIPMIEAGHPLPDSSSVYAAHQALEFARSATKDDVVLTLLSGGASANWAAPAPGLTLDDKRAITRHLLQSGASIGDINAVRKRLSLIKGGRLALAAAPASIVTLAISDVPGDDPAAIGSGPTVADPITYTEALRIAEHYATPLGPAQFLFSKDHETPKPHEEAFDKTIYKIIMTGERLLEEAGVLLASNGYEPIQLGSNLQGEAKDVACQHAVLAREMKAARRRVALVSGGELTVRVRGKGQGGPNQEYALALALALNGLDDVSALAADTDGTDGGTGLISDPAGAIIDPSTLERARKLNLDARAFLDANDSTQFFESLGDLFKPGPTYTNVNDLRILLVDTKT